MNWTPDEPQNDAQRRMRWMVEESAYTDKQGVIRWEDSGEPLAPHDFEDCGALMPRHQLHEYARTTR